MLKTFQFKATIYQNGINWCVDVPDKISAQLQPVKGYIRIHGEINKFPFTTHLVPVKNAPYRLFVNLLMMKGGKTALGETASFAIRQAPRETPEDFPMPPVVAKALKTKKLKAGFDALTTGRKKDILRYLNNIKTPETLQKNTDLLIEQLKKNEKDVRIPLGKKAR